MRLSGSVVFTTLLAAFFLVFGIMGAGYVHNAWIYPILAGSVGFIVTLIQLVRDLKAGGKVESTGFDIEADRSVPTALLYRRAGKFMAWIVVLYVSIWLLGFKLATILYLILFFKAEGHATWRTTILLSLIMFIFLVLFEILLGIYWPDNLLQSIIKLPYVN